MSLSSLSKSGWLNIISILIILTSQFSAKCISLWGKLLNCHQSRKYQLIFSHVEVRCPWSDHHWFTGCTRLLWEQLSGRNVAFIIKAHSAKIRFKRQRVASWCLKMDDRLSCKSFTSELVQSNRMNKEKEKEWLLENNFAKSADYVDADATKEAIWLEKYALCIWRSSDTSFSIIDRIYQVSQYGLTSLKITGIWSMKALQCDRSQAPNLVLQMQGSSRQPATRTRLWSAPFRGPRIHAFDPPDLNVKSIIRSLSIIPCHRRSLKPGR